MKSTRTILLGLALLVGAVAVGCSSGGRPETQAESKELVYIQAYQEGVELFRQGRREQSRELFLRSARNFREARLAMPDSTGPLLNEAYARLHAAEAGGVGDEIDAETMSLLDTYVRKEDSPAHETYLLLTKLYLRDGQPEKAAEVADRALADLSGRPSSFRVSGTRGVEYRGVLEEAGRSRSVRGTVPDRVLLSEVTGPVIGTFRKRGGEPNREGGQLRVELYVQGAEVASGETTSVSESVRITLDLSDVTPLAELRSLRQKALDQAGKGGPKSESQVESSDAGEVSSPLRSRVGLKTGIQQPEWENLRSSLIDHRFRKS